MVVCRRIIFEHQVHRQRRWWRKCISPARKRRQRLLFSIVVPRVNRSTGYHFTRNSKIYFRVRGRGQADIRLTSGWHSCCLCFRTGEVNLLCSKISAQKLILSKQPFVQFCKISFAFSITTYVKKKANKSSHKVSNKLSCKKTERFFSPVLFFFWNDWRAEKLLWYFLTFK